MNRYQLEMRAIYKEVEKHSKSLPDEKQNKVLTVLNGFKIIIEKYQRENGLLTYHEVKWPYHVENSGPSYPVFFCCKLLLLPLDDVSEFLDYQYGKFEVNHYAFADDFICFLEKFLTNILVINSDLLSITKDHLAALQQEIFTWIQLRKSTEVASAGSH